MVLSLSEALGRPVQKGTLFDALALPVSTLDLTAQTSNCFRDANFTHVWQVATRLSKTFVSGTIARFGPKLHKEVETILGERGVELGLEIDNDLLTALMEATQKTGAAAPSSPQTTKPTGTDFLAALNLLEKRAKEHYALLLGESASLKALRHTVRSGVDVTVTAATPERIATVITKHKAEDTAGSTKTFDERIERIDRAIQTIDHALFKRYAALPFETLRNVVEALGV
jgi:hypothetical protein